VAFVGTLPAAAGDLRWKESLGEKLDCPTAGPALRTLTSADQHIVVLVEDNTRHTPVREILPILCGYLVSSGCSLGQIELLVAPGTHRILSDGELLEKLGPFAMENLKVSQHDYRKEEELVRLPDVEIGDRKIPVLVNRLAVEADLLIGVGNIIPHPNAGFSGGAKILDPGCCGRATVSATHTAAALMGYLPLGAMENACRDSMEAVAREVGLNFIINVVLNERNEVVSVVTGDTVRAHRAGARKATEVFGIPIQSPADIVISCSYPYDIDFWQCEKAMITGYFAVKQGGILIVPAPCLEGLAHNHDELLEWTQLSSAEACRRIRELDPSDMGHDLVAAGIAVDAALVREKAEIYLCTPNLTDEQVSKLGCRHFTDVQDAVDAALAARPGGTVGILPRGGDCMPYPAEK
jgi:nickel-dependent lactate racemase